MLLLLAALGAVAAALLVSRRAAAMVPAGSAAAGDAGSGLGILDVLPDLGGSWAPDLSGAFYAAGDAVMGWKNRAAPYQAVIEQAAARHGVPGDLLLRVAYQESHFRDDIISGATASPAGALGMFQFMPATARELGVDPLNIASAADGAARYLSKLRKQFGTWALALMAYNWGQGNVGKYLKGEKQPPKETRDYVAQIGADTGYA